MFAKQNPAFALLAAAVLMAGCAMTSTRQATAQALDALGRVTASGRGRVTRSVAASGSGI